MLQRYMHKIFKIYFTLAKTKINLEFIKQSHKFQLSIFNYNFFFLLLSIAWKQHCQSNHNLAIHFFCNLCRKSPIALNKKCTPKGLHKHPKDATSHDGLIKKTNIKCQVIMLYACFFFLFLFLFLRRLCYMQADLEVSLIKSY